MHLDGLLTIIKVGLFAVAVVKDARFGWAALAISALTGGI